MHVCMYMGAQMCFSLRNETKIYRWTDLRTDKMTNDERINEKRIAIMQFSSDMFVRSVVFIAVCQELSGDFQMIECNVQFS